MKNVTALYPKCPSKKKAHASYHVFPFARIRSAFILLLLFVFPIQSWALTGRTQKMGPDFVISIGCCTGVLIAPNWILTAHHVAKNVPVGTSLSFNNQKTTVQTIHLSPAFQASSVLRVPISDMGLIELSDPITLPKYPTLGKEITASAKERILTQRVTISAYPYQNVPEVDSLDTFPLLQRALIRTAKTTTHYKENAAGQLYWVINASDGVTLEVGNSGAPLLLNNTIVLGIAHSSGRFPDGETYGYFWFPGNDRQWIDETTQEAARWTVIR